MKTVKVERETTWEWLTVSDLSAMPTLAVGQADDLKYDDGEVRMWLSRCTARDGLVGSRISYERLENGRWMPHRESEAGR